MPQLGKLHVLLVEAADAAMYQTKQAGCGRAVIAGSD